MARLFLGCPIPPETAASIAEWASKNVPGRPVPPPNLHVTLMFFGDIGPEEVPKMIDLTRGIDWPSLAVQTSSLEKFGRSALALRLIADPDELQGLKDRLSTPDSLLSRLAKFLPAREAKRPPQLKLHVTVARVKKAPLPELFRLPVPPLAFHLDRVALYESVLRQEGAEYRELASSRRE